MSLSGHHDDAFNAAAMVPLSPRRVAAYVLDDAPPVLPHPSLNMLRDAFTGVRATFKLEGAEDGLQYLARTTLWSLDPDIFSFGADIVTSFVKGDIAYDNGRIIEGSGQRMPDTPFIHTTMRRIHDKIRKMDAHEP